MTYIILASVLVPAALSYGLGFYFRTAEADLLKAGTVWDEAKARISNFVSDDETPDVIARDVAMFAAIAGCGCFMTSALREMALVKIGRHSVNRESVVSLELAKLTSEQRQELAFILSRLVLFDSFNAPIAGRVFRHLMNRFIDSRSAPKAREEELEQFQTVMVSAHHVADRQARHGKLPHGLRLA